MPKINYLEQFSTYLDSIGLKQKSYHNYEWLVHTVHGALKISVHENDFTKSGKLKSNKLASIYCAFQDKMCEEFLRKFYNKRFITCWKWNFNISGGESEVDRWNECFSMFKREIEKIKIFD